MFDASLRQLKDRLGEPLATRLGGTAPDALTLVALAAGLAAAACALWGFYGLAFVLWLLNRSLDGLDGLVARLHGTGSDFGGYLDILADFVVYAALPIALVFGAPNPERYRALTLLLAAYYVNAASWIYLAAILEKRRAGGAATTIVMPAGLIGGAETIVAYCLFFVFPARMTLLFGIFAGLVAMTVLQRLIWARRRLREIGS